MNERPVAVVGAGIAGLAAALELRAAGVPVRVIEAGSAPGGVMATERREGFVWERGPNTFRVNAETRTFLEREGRLGELVAAGPESRERSLYHDGHLLPVPGGPGSAITTPLLSLRGKLRALRELLVVRGDPSGESVDAFVRRRLGDEVLERLVAPFLVGVYAGDERELGIEAVFPALAAIEREHGSLLRGALAARVARLLGRRGVAGLAGSWSHPDGLGAFALALAGGLGEELALGTRVAAITPLRNGFRVETEAAGGIDARAVVLATPAGETARLVESMSPELAEGLRHVRYAPLVSVPLAVDPVRSRVPIRGFGFLVPRAAGLPLLGALFMSRVFPRRAPAGRELVMGMIGGLRWPGAFDAPDDAVLSHVSAGLERTLGLRDGYEALAVERWASAVPQPGTDHPRRVQALRAHAALQGALQLAGSYLDGVSVSDTLVSGLRAARELLARPA